GEFTGGGGVVGGAVWEGADTDDGGDGGEPVGGGDGHLRQGGPALVQAGAVDARLVDVHVFGQLIDGAHDGVGDGLLAPVTEAGGDLRGEDDEREGRLERFVPLFLQLGIGAVHHQVLVGRADRVVLVEEDEHRGGRASRRIALGDVDRA